MMEVLRRTNEYHDQISKAGDEVLDSKVICLLTASGAELTRKLAQGGEAFNPSDFTRRLASHYVRSTSAIDVAKSDPTAFCWAELGGILSSQLRPAPRTFHMLGPMSAMPKARTYGTQTQRRRRHEVQGEAMRPVEVVLSEASQRDDGSHTTNNMKTIMSVLRNQNDKKAPFLELVMNHKSFAQTVENMFSLSFLMRDGRIALEADDLGSGVKVVALHIPEEQKAQRPTDKKEERLQFVIPFNFEEWEKWKKVVDPAATLMPHRVEDDRQQFVLQEQQRTETDTPVPSNLRSKKRVRR